jgi:hypothetical protein
MDLTSWIRRDQSHTAANLVILLGDTNVILKLSRSHLVTIRLQIVYLATQYTTAKHSLPSTNRTTEDARENVMSSTPIRRIRSNLCRISRNTHLQQNYVQMAYTDFHHNRTINVYIKRRVKQYLYRPGKALRVPESWSSQISGQSEHEGSKVVSPMHRTPLHPRQPTWYSFLSEAESTPGP